MKLEVRVVLLLFYVLLLHAIAIFFFTRGFLLTRNELPLSSHCNDFSQDVGCNLHGLDQFVSDPPFCWTSPAVKKVVILIFDALRFDFVAPSNLFPDNSKPWMDKLHVIQKLISGDNPQAKLFKFIADPPTTSLQRLKGLTTGSLPTFIDVGNSFGAPAIVEDNIIQQLAENGRRVIMMGDDTWLQLFPSQFSLAFPFPSFNVKDLHTVDDGVIKHLFPALAEDNWDVLIGHFLGVDHVGHIFGVESSHMIEKLEQYNDVVEEVISILQNQSHVGGLHEDTLLLVMGDHGQTLNGDHGGGTSEEVETALFAWVPWRPAPSASSFRNSSCVAQLDGVRQSCIWEFQQLDFSATLAALLGVPFPFGSIGQVNFELFGLTLGMQRLRWQHGAGDKHEEDLAYLKWLEDYNDVLCLNSWQVNRYFMEYTESAFSGFSSGDSQALETLYQEARSKPSRESVFQSESRGDLVETKAFLIDRITRYTNYLRAAASLARSKWTQFDDGAMGFGLLMLIFSLFAQTVAVHCVNHLQHVISDLKSTCVLMLRSKTMYKESFCFRCISTIVLRSKTMCKESFCFRCITAIVLASIFIPAFVFYGEWPSLLSKYCTMFMVLGAMMGTVKLLIFDKTHFLNEKNHMEKVGECAKGRCGLREASAAFFCAVYACSVLSNSFILREQQVATFLLVSSGVLDLRTALQQRRKIPQAICFLVMNLIMTCLSGINLHKDNLFESGEKPVLRPAWTVLGQSLIYCVTTYATLAMLWYFIVWKLWKACLLWKRGCSCLLFIGVSAIYLAILVHWVVEDITKQQLLHVWPSVQEFARVQAPHTVYVLVALESFMLLWNARHARDRKEDMQLNQVLEEASFSCLGIWSGLILLLLGRQGPAVILVASIEGWCLLDKQSSSLLVQNYQAETSIAASDHMVTTIQWSLLAVQIFFCTGHRCTFEGLRYAAAFIGFDEFNIYRQGVLLALDTFGASHVLPVVSLGLVVTRGAELASNVSLKLQMSQAFLIYGIVRTLTTTFTTLCVTLQRRHLMVWGLFAPKFVFDAIGLLLTDVVLLLSFLYYLLFF